VQPRTTRDAWLLEQEIRVTAYGTWVSYSGAARISLALVLLAVAGALTYGGTRLPLPLRPRRPGKAASVFMLVAWVLAIATFLVCAAVYVGQVQQAHLIGTPPADPITLVTVAAVIVTFALINEMGQPLGRRAALGSALIGALAAPMIFELPFDLIVMARTYPPIPPHPGLLRALFFLPLFLIEITTVGLLTLSPMVALSKRTFRVLALMFVVFAIWALFGFAYPSSPIPIALNVLSKILAFAATATLFAPEGFDVRALLARGRGQGRTPT
jgi:hypothetical protein